MAKKLLVILGAGSSVPCGMPSVRDLDGLMRTWSRDWAASHGSSDYFDALGQAIDSYYLAGRSGLRPSLNFEKILGEMIALSHWMTPSPWGNTLRQTACVNAKPPHLVFPSPDEYGPAITVRDQLCHLSIALAGHMREQCRALDPNVDPVRRYAALLDGLRGAFDVGIYSLNYDTVALTAWPDAYTGFGVAGAFEAHAVHERREWGFIYHLHGSVHHSLLGRFGNRIEWRADLAGAFEDGHQGHSTDDRSDGKAFPKSTLIAGGFKLDQLLVEPFHSLHAALIRHVYQADAILIGGYGFGDVHVNRALQNGIDALIAAERPPVMVLDYARDDTDPMQFRMDSWAHELCRSLKTDGHFFRTPDNASPPVPAELAMEDAFEVASPHRVALWHGGFDKAAVRLDGIVPWLSGADDAVLVPPTT